MTLLDADSTTRLVERIAAAGVCLSSLEWLAARADLRDSGAFGWKLVRLSIPSVLQAPYQSLADRMFGYRSVTMLLGVRFLAAFLLLAPNYSRPLRASLCVTLAVLAVLGRVRLALGMNSADQMSLLIFAALALGHLAGGKAASISLWFLAGQVCLAYFTAGWLKFRERGWRNGSFLITVLCSRTFGARRIGALLKSRPALAVLPAMAVLIAEILFPVAVIAPPTIMFGILGCALLFHLSVGALMGLNDFTWTFPATYPAVIYCAACLR
jgi:hypothetical protein